MPGSEEILAGLQRIANEAFLYAVLWHVVVAAVLAAMTYWSAPSPRVMGAVAVVPLLSVSGFAWAFHNPFNGAVFAILAVTLAVLTWRAPLEPKQRVTWTRALGALMIAFAWTYPHFLVGQTPLAYIYAAPMGLIPCPTLSLVIGFALLGDCPGGRAWSLTLAGAGVFYALFGVVRLGVMLDLPLLVGAVGLIAREVGSARSHAPVGVAAR